MEEFYSFVGQRLAEGKRVVVATIIDSEGSAPQGGGASMAITEDESICGTIGGGCVERYVVKASRKVFEDGKTRIEDFNLGDNSWSGIGMSCGGKIKMMMRLVEPRERLIVFGSGWVSRACCQIAKMLDYDVVVLDPFAEKELFPGCEVYTQGILHKVKEMPITKFDSILMLTDHRYDFEALSAVIDSNARFIGMIGSKNRVNQTFKQLAEKGTPTEKVFQVYAPVGIDIGAISPAEIAVSIMAEVIHAKKGGSLQHLRLTRLLEKPEKTHELSAQEEAEHKALVQAMSEPPKTQ
ncbi:MAG: XdhC family protein [Nitrososphaerales archaeon]|jgi:xanthine dehydrogenase accessory factor